MFLINGIEQETLPASDRATQFVDVEDYTKLRILGGTRDDAAGECFDKVARLLGMPYPGGAALDRAAQGGDPSRYPMPRPHLSGNPLDLSFSGLKTSAVNLIHNAGQKGEQIVIPDLCAAFSEAVCGMLVPRAMLALEQTGRKTLAVAGGLATHWRWFLVKSAKAVAPIACALAGALSTPPAALT